MDKQYIKYLFAFFFLFLNCLFIFGCATSNTDYFELGKAFYYLKQYDKAIDCYDQTIKKNLTNAKAYNNRGTAYHQKEEYDKAIVDFNKALLINLKNYKAHNNRGAAYYEKGIYDQAIKDFKKAIELNPEYREAAYNQEIAYHQKNKSKTDIKDSQNSNKIIPAYLPANDQKQYPIPKKGDSKKFKQRILANKEQLKPIPVDIIAKQNNYYYSVQYASCKSKSIAENLVKKYFEKGFPAFIKQFEIEGLGVWHRVFIGKYTNRKQARLYGEFLKSQGEINDYLIQNLN